ncbi:hypothetical protein [Helicobacter pylori]|uniref:hypothetical protein n=1 Tax=Helicobacter pylori TaxID=210 RepID=UPI000EB0AAC6|nr:hypothetical protein [Helicobacter pylori]
MIEVSEILSKVRARLNDNHTDNCMFSDSVLIDSLNQAILNLTLEFRLNRQLVRQVLDAENPFLKIYNLLGIESAKFNTEELKERTNIMKDNGALELLILGDKLSVTPFKDGELEVVYFSYNDVNNILESVSMPRVCLEALVYSVLIDILEIPTNEANYNLIANYKHLLKMAKNNLANYLNAMYSKNIHFSRVVRV